MDRSPEPKSEQQREIVSLHQGMAAVFCARNPCRDGPNEDAAVVVPVDDDRAILAVADGMGGQPAGHQASEIALTALAAAVRKAAPPDAEPGAGGLRPAILDGFEAANEQVSGSGVGAGTTLAVVEIDGRTIRPYHVGDSLILLVGQRGRIRLHTMAHSPVGYAVESGLLDAADAMHHGERHLVSNFVGTADMRIEIGPTLPLSPRDTVVLASDGLFDNLHVPEVVEIVRKGPLERAVDALASTCRRRMTEPEPPHPSKADDLTFILYRPGPKPSS